MKTDCYDVIIIGGGPAGLSAAIYASREKLGTLLLEQNLCGGWPASTELIENYPGFSRGLKGVELTDEFKKQAERFGAYVEELNGVEKIESSGRIFSVRTKKNEYKSRSLIVASGSNPRRLNIDGEKEYTGKGVSFCALCDAPLYKNKVVMVIGGGNAAAEEVLSLAKFAREVILVHRRPELRAAAILQEELKKNNKIKLFFNCVPLSISGRNFVESVTLKNNETGKEKVIAVSGVFVYVGFLPNSGFIKGLVNLDSAGYIITDERMETSLPGVYAAGDIRSKEVRQVVTACADGAIAAVSVRDYLKKETNK